MPLKFFKFSFLRYWLILILVAILLLWQTFLNDFSGSLKLFAAFGIAGIIGETLVSIWWYHFFNKKFWVYTEATIFHKYTSFLNFIPWGIGGFIYFYITKLIIGGVYGYFPGLEIKLAGIFILCVAAQMIIFKIIFKNHKFQQLTAQNFILFYFPMFFVFLTAWKTGGNQMLWLLFAYGIIASVLEYLFGKFMQLILTKKLWLYTYNTIDNGHFTPLAIPLFSMGGFYFWVLARIVASLLLFHK